MRRFLIAIALTCVAAPLAAQESLDSGSVVRVQPGAHARWRVGRLHRAAEDTLWIATLGAADGREARPVIVPRESGRVEVSADYDAISRRRHRTIAGAGVVMSLFAIWSNSADRESGVPFATSPLVAGIGGFAIGVLGGTVAAEALYPRRWDPVALTPR